MTRPSLYTGSYYDHGGSLMFKQLIERASAFIEEGKFSGLFVALIAFFLVILFSFTDAYQRFDLNLYDLSFAVKPNIEQWDRLTFIDIDDNSTEILGEYPWPRYLYGKGLKVLKEMGVTLSALDIMFLDESPLQVPPKEYAKIKALSAAKKKVSAEEMDRVIINNDELFAEGVKDMGQVILSYNLSPEPVLEDEKIRRKSRSFQKARKRFIERSSVKVPEKDHEKYAPLVDPKTKSIAFPIEKLMRTANDFGFVNRDIDIDGAVRKVRLVQFFNGRLYFNLALVMLMDMCNVAKSNVDVVPGKHILLKKAFNPKTHDFEDIRIPISESGMMFVNWVGPGPREKSFRIIPFFALVEYSNYASVVHDFFDRQGGMDGIMKRSQIAVKMQEAAQAYGRAKDGAGRREAWSRLKKLKKEENDLKKSYVKVLQDEANRIREELKKKKDPKLKKELYAFEQDIKAIELVMKVESLQNDITITGLTATGTVDIGQTPLWKEYALVGAYHNTVNTIIQKNFISRAPSWFNFLVMLVIALIMGFAVQHLSARSSVITIGVSFVVINAAVVLVFFFTSIWVDQLGYSLAMLLPSIAIASVKFMREESQKQFIKNAFSHYLAPGVIDEIIDNPESLELGGEEREITIFFSDVASFSTISEKLTPKELVNLLNEYLSEMTDIILKHGGTVDKYEGDAVMAFFGAPHPFEDHALRACLAAIEQKKRLREMQENWRKLGKDELKVRMGMNTGKAVVGNMGSRTRMDYTAMGAAVNLASRLEGANKFYSTHAMVSEATYQQVKEKVEARRLDIIRVIGKSEPIKIYELLGYKGSLPGYMYDMLGHYYEGLDLFEKRQWKRARSAFQEALKIVEDDGPGLTYIKRCEDYMKKPPSSKWDGVYSLKSK